MACQHIVRNQLCQIMSQMIRQIITGGWFPPAAISKVKKFPSVYPLITQPPRSDPPKIQLSKKNGTRCHSVSKEMEGKMLLSENSFQVELFENKASRWKRGKAFLEHPHRAYIRPPK